MPGADRLTFDRARTEPRCVPRTHRTRRALRRTVTASLVAAAVLSPTAGWAYCRTSVCSGDQVGQICEPPEPEDCGTALYWTKLCVGFSVQQDASAQVPFEAADQVVEEAFTTWGEADCGSGQIPSIEGVNLGPVACQAREYNSSGGNANIVVFRDEQWPYAGQWNTLALTTVTYNLDTGEIYDADLEINGSDVMLTWGDQDVQYDLRSIVTHEVGHMLGLAHSSAPGSTMATEYRAPDTSLRDLEQDDVDGICSLYPPGLPRANLPCDPTPRHGFKTDCGPGPGDDDDGCSVRAPNGGGGFSLALLAAIAWRGRRRGRR